MAGGATVPAVWGSAQAGVETAADAFVEAAVAQRGDRYVFGAETVLDDPDPAAFDCSELTQWAAAQAGVSIPDGAMYQYLDLKSQGQLLPVDEALHTRGALLFYFSSEPVPGGGRPSTAHVAISLGDGQTIEARGTSYGVNEFGGAGRFNYAGVVPGLGEVMDEPTVAGITGQSISSQYDQIGTGVALDEVGDSDGDGLSNAYEVSAGLSPISADTDQDRRSDALELLQGTDPLVAEVGPMPVPAGTVSATDSDDDHLSDAFELARGLDPHNADSDSDGLGDAAELLMGTDPTLVDSDHDGLTDYLEGDPT